MKCSECRGACCEQLILPVANDQATLDFLAVRGQVLLDNRAAPGVRLECPCPKLTDEGRCGIYELRPVICSTYKAGGPACLEAVRRRRPPEDFRRIREEGDPER